MEAILQWGIGFINIVQQIHGPALDSIFRIITFLGTERFYLLLLPLIFWCVDFGLGARLAVILLISTYFNFGLKDILQQPRPFDIDPSVQLSDAQGYGLPSGHAQASIVGWGFIAARINKTWFSVVAILLVILIGFSRIFLGVHFPVDVLAGWVVGAVILGVYLAARPVLERKLLELSLGLQILVILVLPLALIAIHPSAGTIFPMAALSGIGAGLALTRRYVAFVVTGSWWQRTLRFLIGGSIVLALYLSLRVAFPGEGSVLYLMLGYLGYGLTGMWISFGAPWLFCLLKLVPEVGNFQNSIS
ncbi:phosphatase PAP2 family protein [Chloroflexota bacterium]